MMYKYVLNSHTNYLNYLATAEYSIYNKKTNIFMTTTHHLIGWVLLTMYDSV